MPPDGYPALQYLQSVRVRIFSSRPSGAEGPSPGPRMHAIAYPGLETSSAAMNHQFAPRSLLADIRYGCERCAELRQRTLEEVPAQDAGRALVIKGPAYDPLHSIAPAPAPSMGNAGS